MCLSCIYGSTQEIIFGGPFTRFPSFSQFEMNRPFFDKQQQRSDITNYLWNLIFFSLSWCFFPFWHLRKTDEELGNYFWKMLIGFLVSIFWLWYFLWFLKIFKRKRTDARRSLCQDFLWEKIKFSLLFLI